ncbi:MAG: PRC-barrel domain-containing protein [Pseudobdellovibrionaceae bacterium]
MTSTKTPLLASAALLLALSASPAFAAQTCADAISNTKARVDASTNLTADQKADIGADLSEAARLSSQDEDTACLAKITAINTEFGWEASGNAIKEGARDLSDSASNMGRDISNEASNLSDRAQNRADRMEAEADANANIDSAAGVELDAAQVDGMALYNSKNVKLGKVTDVLKNSASGETYLVVTKGGFLGLGGTDYLVPADDASLEANNQLTLSSLDSASLNGYSTMDASAQSNLISVDANQNLGGIIDIER